LCYVRIKCCTIIFIANALFVTIYILPTTYIQIYNNKIIKDSKPILNHKLVNTFIVLYYKPVPMMQFLSSWIDLQSYN